MFNSEYSDCVIMCWEPYFSTHQKNLVALQGYVPHIFRPCCLGGKGECVIVSHKHCVILGGVWHITGVEHCSQANCDSDVCRVYEHTEHEVINNTKSHPIQAIPTNIQIIYLYHFSSLSHLAFSLGT